MKTLSQFEREKRTGNEWKEIIETPPHNQLKIYNQRAYAMLQYIEKMIKDGKLANEILDIIYNFQDWILDEADD